MCDTRTCGSTQVVHTNVWRPRPNWAVWATRAGRMGV
ncbi:hypothetical protein F383_02673 [Gossypium arboreum]|uniref:Uncharacterized protein n=1 Tax=Gossypium arboreum TaxID=29729 RepID=A0A0B0P2L0_GOSAR|nr:hypothetical protein F383_02673 [Gossypium arboreum]